MRGAGHVGVGDRRSPGRAGVPARRAALVPAGATRLAPPSSRWRTTASTTGTAIVGGSSTDDSRTSVVSGWARRCGLPATVRAVPSRLPRRPMAKGMGPERRVVHVVARELPGVPVEGEHGATSSSGHVASRSSSAVAGQVVGGPAWAHAATGVGGERAGIGGGHRDAPAARPEARRRAAPRPMPWDWRSGRTKRSERATQRRGRAAPANPTTSTSSSATTSGRRAQQVPEPRHGPWWRGCRQPTISVAYQTA